MTSAGLLRQCAGRATFACLLAGTAAGTGRSALAQGTGAPGPQTRPARARQSGPDLRKAMREVWSAGIKALPDRDTDAGNEEIDLDELIRQLERVETGAARTRPAPAAQENESSRTPDTASRGETPPVENPPPAHDPDPRPSTRPASRPAEVPGGDAPQGADRAAEAPGPSEALKRLQAGQVEEPARLADSLYADGETEAAAVFYRAALAKDDGGDVDRAWALLQLAHCTARKDLPLARELYERVVAEYPDSPWSAPAEAHSALLAWRLENKPVELLREVRLPSGAAGQTKDEGPAGRAAQAGRKQAKGK